MPEFSANDGIYRSWAYQIKPESEYHAHEHIIVEFMRNKEKRPSFEKTEHAQRDDDDVKRVNRAATSIMTLDIELRCRSIICIIT